MAPSEAVPTFTLELGWERWAPSEYDAEDCNSDVSVVFDDGRTFVGTFFTTANVERLLGDWAKSGEYGGGVYFWAANAVIVRRLDAATVRAAVEDLIRSRCLDVVLERVR